MPKTETAATHPLAQMFLKGDLPTGFEQMFLTAAHMQGIMMRSVLRFNVETARFLHDRLESDMKTAESFADCRSFADLNDAGLAFWDRAIEEYSSESERLAALGSQLFTDTADKLQKESAQATIQ